MWLTNILRSLFFFLDKLIYGLIGTVYNLFNDIANTTIFTNEVLEKFLPKVYALLAIFMLFKVSFSLLSYVVNPDDFMDKTKGGTKLLTNILITLALLVFTPTIFDKAMEVQRLILRDNVIGKIFSSTDINSNVTADPGNVMSYETFKAFYYLDTNIYEECEDIEKGVKSDNCKATAFDGSSSFNDIASELNYASLTNSIDIYTSIDIVNQTDNTGSYTMTYLYLISTLCGGAIVLILISFCFDIAVRSIKLGFLQIISPVPIASRIDPKKGKEVFDKWVKSCLSTYLDLFIRLIAIYFALFIISNIASSGLEMTDVVTNTPKEISGGVKVFIILGALLFAKQLPKLIEDITGIKLSGTFSLNPMNKLRQVPIVGAATTMASAMAGGAITGGIAGAEAGNHVLRGAWQGMLGAGSVMRDKVNWSGDDKGKNPRAFHSGLQSGYKTIKGKDFEIFSPWKELGKEVGKNEVEEMKTNKYALQAEQANLDARLHQLHNKYEQAQTEDERIKIQKDIESNRSQYGKLTKYISVIDDQIKDVKRLYNIDESQQVDFNEAMTVAQGYKSRQDADKEKIQAQQEEVRRSSGEDGAGINNIPE